MSEKHKCCGRINQGYSSYACGKNAKVERDGKWYCGTHDPVARAEKDAARNAKWNAEWDEKHRIHKMSDLAKSRMSRVMMPPPPSANAMYRVARGRQYRSKAYNDWLDIATQSMRNLKPLTKPAVVFITLVRGKGVTVRSDIDNLVKPVLDALKPPSYDKLGNLTKAGSGVIADDSLEYVRSVAAIWQPAKSKKEVAYIIVEVSEWGCCEASSTVNLPADKNEVPE